ncbi:MAG: permease [Desulfobacteraceae bacterium]
MNVLYELAGEVLDIYLDVSVYMLFGFFVAGILYVFFKADSVKKYLGTGTVRPVIYSSLFGIPLPLCSCGVVPVAAGLKKQGANDGAALAFMISTPESGVDSIAVSYALLDPIMTVIRPVAGFFTAVSTGIAENVFNKTGAGTPVKEDTCSPASEEGG